MNNFDPLRGNTWADYMGDMLRGKQPINQLIPNHPYIDTLPQMERLLEKNTQYFMLLTLEEARGVLSDLMGKSDDYFSYKIGGGNFKDIWDGVRNISKFSTYFNEANQLRFNLNCLGITAKTCRYGGVAYIKITGYPSLRRIINGTRYRSTNLQLLELGIGWRGLAYSFYKGVKFCVYFSLAFRAIELIFKSEYTIIDFLGDVIADTAKSLVSVVVAGTVGLMMLGAPVIISTFVIIGIALYMNVKLNKLDRQNGWSNELKDVIKSALNKEQEIYNWNNMHMSTGISPNFR